MSEAERMAFRISDSELERRWTAVREGMAARGIDALVMQNTNDWLGGYVKWFTDIPATNGYPRSVVFFADASMVSVEMGPFDGRIEYANGHPLHRGIAEILTTPSFTSTCYTQAYDGELVVEAIARRGCRRIGLLGRGALPAGFVDVLDATGLVVADDLTYWVDMIKAVKSPEERVLIEQVAQVQDAVFADVLGQIRPGVRDVDITAFAQLAGQKLGSEQGIFLTGSNPLGRASVFLPRFLQGRKLSRGDHLTLLIEINSAGGYYTEIARTIVLGRPSAELEDGFAAMCEAQAHTLGLLRPGASCRDIAAAHDDHMIARGLPPERRIYSHGQGYDMVERPLIRRDETMELAAGMCLAVHPGYTTPEVFAVVCDNYFVTADGPSHCLHRTEKKIFEVAL